MPSITLSGSTSSNFTIGHIPGTYNTGTDNANVHGFPTSSLTLGLGSYTVFNFWKDYDAFRMASIEWTRAKQSYNEQIRAFRNSVTTAFFSYRATLEKLDAAKKSIEFSESILGLIKSRARVKHTENDESEIASSSIDLINSKNNYNSLETSSKAQLYQLNDLLNDPIGTEYIINEKLRYIPIKITLDEAMKTYFAQSPEILDQRKSILLADINLSLAQKSRLPLPKVVLSPINVVMSNSYYASTVTQSTSGSSANLDLQTSISFSVPITGPGGLLNHRGIEQSEISRSQADVGYLITANSGKMGIHSAFNQIRQAEIQLQNNEQSAVKSAEILDAAFKRLLSGNVNRLELRDAISQARETQLQLEDGYVNHLQSKLSLAQRIGVDHLPGDIY